MTKTAMRKIREERESEPSRLGPAVVREVLGRSVRVSRADGSEAVADLAFPYDPVVGDVLLVIGDSDAYAIGVISGQGRHSLALQGDVAIRAIGGALDLSGDNGVRIRGPSVEVCADALKTVARSAIEVLETLHQRVSALLSVHAGQSHTVVEDECHTQAKRASIQTEDTVTINGKEIHLG